MSRKNTSRPINQISRGSKNFYSAGTSFSVIGCACLVEVAWVVAGRLFSLFQSDWTALGLSILIVAAYAFVIPEPFGYPDEGRLVLTGAEVIFGLFNALFICAIAIGLKCIGV